MNEKALRLKYIRVLEKFVKRSISLLKSDDFDFEAFKEKVIGYYEEVKNAKEVRLDSQYMQKLKAYIGHILNSIENHTEDFQEEREMLLKEANLLHKEKNKTVYKKEKHKHSKFNDGY